MVNQGAYEGNWLNGQANGFGRYVFPDKSTFTANWVNNVAQG